MKKWLYDFMFQLSEHFVLCFKDHYNNVSDNWNTDFCKHQRDLNHRTLR